jgi:hypothetical protein
MAKTKVDVVVEKAGGTFVPQERRGMMINVRLWLMLKHVLKIWYVQWYCARRYKCKGSRGLIIKHI